MGCVASDAGNPSQSLHASKHAIDNSLTPDMKQKIRKIIERDSLIQLIVLLDSQKIPLYAQLSPTNSKWMMTHFCCRWDADNCLQFLLKNYFVSHPRQYIDYVNSMSVQGWTPLHLCSIWRAQKAFNVLHYYGGLNLKSKDKNKSTPLTCAVQSRCDKIVNCLAQYKQLKIGFTKVEGQKLTSGSVISQKTTDKPQMKITKITVKQNQISEEEKKLREDKKNLENNIKIIKQTQIQSQIKNVQQKEKTDTKNQKAQMNFDQQKYEKELEKKYEQNMKAQKLKYQSQFKQKEIELQKLKTQLKQTEDRRVNEQKIKAQKQTEKFALEKEQKLKELAKTKEQAVGVLKKKEIPPPPIQKPKANNNINQGSLEQSFKAIKQAVPAQILELYNVAKQNQLFEDQQFPADQPSIGDKSNENYKHFKDNIIWLRPSQIFGQDDFKLFNGIDPNDIQQGELGVCYMLATLSSLAEKSSHIQKLFVFSDIKLGFYVLRFYTHGIPTFYVIDDQIPCDKNSNFPIFTQPVGNQLWVILLEKCWAKAIGSYLSAEGMVPDQMMEDLSGAPGFGGYFKGEQSKISVAEHIKILEKHTSLGHTTVLSSGDKKIDGLVNGHAYTLMKVFQINGKYIFKVRNPWGSFEWKGQYGGKSKLLTPQIKKAIGYTEDDDGIFFISQSQLVLGFDYYSISILMDTHIYSFVEFTSSSNQNLFFKFTLKKAGYANIRISQKFDRMLNDPNYKYSPAKFQVGRIDKNKVKFIGEGDGDTYYGAKSIHFTENVCEQLQAGDYFIRVNMQWADQQNYNSGVLSVYAPEKVEIKPLDQKAGTQLMKSLFYSHSELIPKQATEDGLGFYRIDTMKGQFVFTAQTQQAGNFQVQFQFVQEQMEGVQLDIGKAQEVKIRLPVSKGKPAVGTANIITTADGGTSGSVYITMTKK